MQTGFPPENDDSEYVFYVEKALPTESARRNYFESLFEGKRPSVGYTLLPIMYKQGTLKSVWTTNFDQLAYNAFHNSHIVVYNVAIADKENVYDILSYNKFIHIALHGDYKYSKLKNTEKELYEQESEFVDAITTYFKTKHLVVMGYSGRDESLMKTLKLAFQSKGVGNLFWIGLEKEPRREIAELLYIAKQNGRDAFYVQGVIFDELISRMVKVAYNDLPQVMEDVRRIESQHVTNTLSKPFEIKIERNNINGIIESNIFPVKFPTTCFVLDLKCESSKLWHEVTCRIKAKRISAVVFKNQVYALGPYDDINAAFQGLIQNIQIQALTEKACVEISVLRRLVLQAILIGLSDLTGLKIDFRSKILWDYQCFYNNMAGINHAIKLSLEYLDIDNSITFFISIAPTLSIDRSKYADHQIKELLRSYADGLRNGDFHRQIENWNYRIFRNSNTIVFGLHPNVYDVSNQFKISKNSGYCSILSSENNISLPQAFNRKRICLTGKLLQEPKLRFSHNQKSIYDENPMRGLCNFQPFDTVGMVASGENIPVGVICPSSYKSQVEQVLQTLKLGGIPAYGKDYFNAYEGFYSAYKCNLDIPYANSPNWISCKDSQINAQVLADNICRHMQKMPCAQGNGVVIIFIPESWSKLRTISNNGIEVDFHDYIKSYAAQYSIATQFIEEKTIKQLNIFSQKCKIYWWLSLAIFVKSGRVPWALNDLDENSAYAGIGYSIDSTKNNGKHVVVGCSHLYNCHGNGLRFRLKRIEDAHIIDKKNPYLSHREAYNFGLTIIDMFRQSMTTMPKRVVIHKRTIFQDQEVKGLVEALSPHVDNIDLITIEETSRLRFTDILSDGVVLRPKSYPIARGTCIPISKNEGLLWTHGSVQSKEAGRLYFVGGKGIPRPLKITKCYGNSSLEIIATEILSFTKLNWNSFEYHSKLPATIDTSNNAARIGKLLNQYDGHAFDSRFFM